MKSCNNCIQNKDLCPKCKWNPIYKDLHDYKKLYEPVCPFGYTDCVCDSAYIKYHYPKWSKELYGDKTPEEAGCYCENGRGYDNEDK